ncbi:hypothetical protein ACFSUS_22570 [Spirosoma soli]|uniref:Uncharacterized protein n=1 Tax=Spirosoma soli TaxID=1770529 RepID=A0ABW5MD14_9BACT
MKFAFQASLNFVFLQIFEPIVAVDGPVPGIDPQWFRTAFKAIALTAIQNAVQNVSVGRTAGK